MKKFLIIATIALTSSCFQGQDCGKVLKNVIGSEVITRADSFLEAEPVTVTAAFCERSAGGPHDFYSEGDYWWPNPNDPEGPYIRRDGESNPDNFTAHRHAMIRLSEIVGTLTSAYLLSGDAKYADAVSKHIIAWFIDPETMMNPNLLYAQAIKGIATGRGIGIIDTLHLTEVFQSLLRLREAGVLSDECYEGSRKWVEEYLAWMSTHPYGLAEMKASNNHGTCWAVQAAIFAKYTENEEIMNLCRQRYKEVFLSEQMAPDGSFPKEIARTKPYGYSLFNLDAMAALCQILSTDEDNLWDYATEDGKCMKKAIDYMLPYIADKSVWPFAHDVMYWDEWPVAHPTLIFAWAHFKENSYLEQWEKLDHFPTNEEVVRNLPLRNPVIWLTR